MASKKQTKKTDLPWLGIALILAAGVIISGVLMFSRNQPKKNKDVSGESYTVSFYNGQSLIEERTVQAGESVKPPLIENCHDGQAFCGWTITPVDIQENTETQVMMQNIQEDENCFYASPAYVTAKESFSVDLNYGGICCFKEGSIVIGFDSDTVKYKGAEAALSGVSVEKLDGNRLVVKVNSEENITDAGRLVTLNFQAKKRSQCVMSLPMKAVDFFYEENRNYFNCNTTTIAADIYIY